VVIRLHAWGINCEEEEQMRIDSWARPPGVSKSAHVQVASDRPPPSTYNPARSALGVYLTVLQYPCFVVQALTAQALPLGCLP